MEPAVNQELLNLERAVAAARERKAPCIVYVARAPDHTPLWAAIVAPGEHAEALVEALGAIIQLAPGEVVGDELLTKRRDK